MMRNKNQFVKNWFSENVQVLQWSQSVLSAVKKCKTNFR